MTQLYGWATASPACATTWSRSGERVTAPTTPARRTQRAPGSSGRARGGTGRPNRCPHRCRRPSAPTVPVPPSAPAGHRPPAVPLVPPQAAGPAASHPAPAAPDLGRAAPHRGAARDAHRPTGVPAPARRSTGGERPGAVARVLGAAGAVITLRGRLPARDRHRGRGLGPVPASSPGRSRRRARRRRGRARAVHRDGRRQALVATGLAAAYLDLLAATALYDFIPGPADSSCGTAHHRRLRPRPPVEQSTARDPRGGTPMSWHRSSPGSPPS